MGSLDSWKADVAAGRTPEPAKLLKEYVADTVKAEGERKYTFAISTGAVDRERDTVAVDGWQLDNYRKNPVVLWAHDYGGLPVGRAESVIARSGQLVARMEFVPAEVYPFAETVRQLVDGGFLKATSVGFRPLENGWKFNDARGGYDFTKQELLEFSIVPVPANPEALVAAKDAGIVVSPLKEWAIKVLDSYRLSDEEREQAARVLKIAANEPVSISVSGASMPDAAPPHAGEQSGDEPEPENPTKAAEPPVEKAGRVISAANEARIKSARDLLDECLNQISTEDEATPKAVSREARLIVLRQPEPRKFTINPESVKQLVADAIASEVRCLRGRLD